MNRAEKLDYTVRLLLAVIFIALMTFCAEFIGNKEIIFPEIGALALGLWVSDKKVWSVRKWQIPLLFTLASVAGIMIVRHVPLSLPWQFEIGFLFMVLVLMTLKTSMTPAISACLLPILMGTDSWVYPLSVVVMTAILAIGQKVMENKGLKEVFDTAKTTEEPLGKTLLRWLMLMIALVPIMVVTTHYGWKFALTPPLIVTMVEFASSHSGFRDRPVSIWITIVLCAILGAAAEGVAHQMWGVPQTINAILVSLIVLLSFRLTKKSFAPAVAIALVPMILPAEAVIWFPLYVMGGAGYFIGVSKMIVSY